MRQFYAYVHARPDGRIFYVGKGHGARSKNLVGRNMYHRNVVDKHGAENILVGEITCSSEEIAFELERGLIKCLKRAGVKLTNMTDGGEGTSGYQHTEKAKELCRIAASGKNNFFYGKKRPNHSTLLTGRKRPDHAERMRRYFAENISTFTMRGKKHSPETITKMKSHGGKVGARASTLFKGVAKPASQKAKMSEAATGHVWLHKDGKRTHCKEEKAVVLEKDGWKRGQK